MNKAKTIQQKPLFELLQEPSDVQVVLFSYKDLMPLLFLSYTFLSTHVYIIKSYRSIVLTIYCFYQRQRFLLKHCFVS